MNETLVPVTTPVPSGTTWISQIGVLRWLVAVLVVLAAPCAFLQDMPLSSPWDVLIGAVLPGVALFFIWAIPLDILMAKVFKAEADAATRVRYQTVIRFDLLVMLILLLSWGYFFLQIMLQRLT